MDKTAIKNFAVRARVKLMEDIRQKAYELGINEKEIKDIEVFEGGFRVKGLENSKIYKKYEIDQREKLLAEINTKGLDQVTEEVAYTWFNRFIALRFMEVNEYLPTGVRVLSSLEEGKTEPDIISEALELAEDLDLDKEIIYKLMDAGDTEDLYKYLIIKQCNQLGSIMPMVFEEISDYTELLLPDGLLTEGSVVMDLVQSIEEDDYKEQVEIIGWMYQYYISEKKDEVFAGLKKNKKITKENIPAATQLFTPKWIVKYMVENSLGRLWLESHPDEELKARWKYYLEEAEQDPEVQQKLDELKDPNLNPEDIKILDPAMGSGHILVYAFDVLYDIYLKANYSERDIPKLILEKNLYGLDIDDRAGQLAAFALMMKARSKNRRVFRRKIDLNICSIQESNILIENENKELNIHSPFCQYFLGNSQGEEREKLGKDFKYIVDVFYDAKEYGSILEVEKIDFDGIEKRLEEIEVEDTKMFDQGYKNVILENMPSLLEQARIMSDKYDVVCTNPPYMGRRSMNSKLIKYLDNNYSVSKSDIFSVFMDLDTVYLKENGFISMINQQSWMFLSSFNKLREKIIKNNTITSMLHLGARAFEEISGEVVQSTSFVYRNIRIHNYRGTYIRLIDYNNSSEKEKRTLATIKDKTLDYVYECRTDDLSRIPGNPIAYWVSDKIIKTFKTCKSLRGISESKQGMATSDNNRFLRIWYEADYKNIGFNFESNEEVKESKLKWFPHNKGGGYRRWYGNNEYVVNWKNNGQEIKKYKSSVIRNPTYYFRKGITWSDVSTGKFSARYVEKGFTFDSAGPTLFCKSEYNEYIFTAYMNSKVFQMIVDIVCTGLHYSNGAIAKIPIKIKEDYITKIEEYSQENIHISKKDWDSFETSWDFKKHPLMTKHNIVNNRQRSSTPGQSEQSEESYKTIKTIEQAFINWQSFTESQFQQLKSNEEELNKIFIEIYELEDELTPEVADKDITISKADRERDIKSFISYAVGCMFGRYSLDEEGLIYAGGDFKDKFKIEEDILKISTSQGWKKSSIHVTMDNIIIIADDDYFEDDITNRFIEFIKTTFGPDTLEENLDYIAGTLKQKSKETSRQAIRRYFVKDFYKDHTKTYSARGSGKLPIYWQFDSGKQDGFKALIYMHRYDASTVARVRTDYLHEIQKRYEAEINHLDILLDSDLSPREEAAALKRKTNINKQIEECIAYDQVISHVANQEIEFDLDDGVKVNYAKFQGVEVPQGDGMKPIKADLLRKV